MDVLTQENYDKTLNSGIVLIDFFAEWCGPCHVLSPVLEELSKKYEGRVGFYKLDVDQAPPIAARYQIMSIPTVMIFKDGKEVTKIVGSNPESRYIDALEEILK